MVQRSNYTAPIQAFDETPNRVNHSARTWILMALRELPAEVLKKVAETPRKFYSPEHDAAARTMAEHLVLTLARHMHITEHEDGPVGHGRRPVIQEGASNGADE